MLWTDQLPERQPDHGAVPASGHPVTHPHPPSLPQGPSLHRPLWAPPFPPFGSQGPAGLCFLLGGWAALQPCLPGPAWLSPPPPPPPESELTGEVGADQCSGGEWALKISQATPRALREDFGLSLHFLSGRMTTPAPRHPSTCTPGLELDSL